MQAATMATKAMKAMVRSASKNKLNLTVAALGVPTTYALYGIKRNLEEGNRLAKEKNRLVKEMNGLSIEIRDLFKEGRDVLIEVLAEQRKQG